MTDFATIYLPVEPPTTEALVNLPGVKEAVIMSGSERCPEQYKVQFLNMVLTINVMSDKESPIHLKEFSNYVMSLHIKNKKDATVSVLERIATMKSVLGCVIEPSFDNEGFIGGLLTSIIENNSGLMFAKDRIFDSDGTILIRA